MKKIIINLPIFSDKCIFNICQAEEFKLKKRKYDCQFAEGFCVGNLIFLQKKDKQDIPLICHELIHAVFAILKAHSIQDEQALAYIFQYILKQYLKRVQ